MNVQYVLTTLVIMASARLMGAFPEGNIASGSAEEFLGESKSTEQEIQNLQNSNIRLFDGEDEDQTSGNTENQISKRTAHLIHPPYGMWGIPDSGSPPLSSGLFRLGLQPNLRQTTKLNPESDPSEYQQKLPNLENKRLNMNNFQALQTGVNTLYMPNGIQEKIETLDAENRREVMKVALALHLCNFLEDESTNTETHFYPYKSPDALNLTPRDSSGSSRHGEFGEDDYLAKLKQTTDNMFSTIKGNCMFLKEIFFKTVSE